MKSLNNYITEWKVAQKSMTSVKVNIDSCFMFRLDKNEQLKIFDYDWKELDNYLNKVYINGKQLNITKSGNSLESGITKENYNPGIYYVEIKDLDKVSNFKYVFFSDDQLVSVPLFNTENVADMSYMFSTCDILVNVPLFNTSNVKNMESMFGGCKKLKKVPLFDTRNVEDMTDMFCDCDELEEVPLFDTRNVKKMNWMFKNCNKLSEKTKRQWSTVYDFEKHCKK